MPYSSALSARILDLDTTETEGSVCRTAYQQGQGRPFDFSPLKRGKHEILVVDDESDFCELLYLALTQQNYIVYRAEDGEEALRIFRERSPDMVLTDLVMPKMSGAGLIRELGKFDVPVIAFSGYPMEENSYEHALVAQGSRAFLRKPFRIEDLVTVVADNLRHGEKPHAAAALSLIEGGAEEEE
jgi:DNA-binding response OmpR family regulator